MITGGSRGLARRSREGVLARGCARSYWWPATGDLERVANEIRTAGARPTRWRRTWPARTRRTAIAEPPPRSWARSICSFHNASTSGRRRSPAAARPGLRGPAAVLVGQPHRSIPADEGGGRLDGPSRTGLIVHVTSYASVTPYARWGAYGVSKAALDHLRPHLEELAGTGVRFLTLDPGEMNTRMHAEAMPEADPATLADPDAVAARILRLIRSSDEIPSGQRLEVA